jgi:hypothetical protein
VLVGRKRLDYSADTTFGAGQSNWATAQRLAGVAEAGRVWGIGHGPRFAGRELPTVDEQRESTSTQSKSDTDKLWRCLLEMLRTGTTQAAL